MVRFSLGSLVAGLVGAISGFAAQWPVALLSMRLNGAGYTDVTPRWDPSFAVFDASLHGAPVGGVLAIAAYLLFFSSYPPALIARWVPTLFLFTLLGAFPGIWLGPGALVSVVIFFLGGCVFVARRLSRQQLLAHPFR